MDQLLNIIQSHFPLLEQYKYLWLFIGSAIEGFNIIIFAGFLASIDAVGVVRAFLVCLAGEFLNGCMWYAVGYFGGSRPIDKWGRNDEKRRGVIEMVERYFHRYSGRAIIFTKLTWSLTIVTMIMAGSFKYGFKKFAWYNFIGGLGWTTLTFTIGYVFGEGYKATNLVNNIGYAALFLLLAIGIIFLLKVIFKSKFVQSMATMERLRAIGERIREGIDRMMRD